jgi:SAM-dependent methyltransferase
MKTTDNTWKSKVKSFIRSLVPLFIRKKLAICVNRQDWIASSSRGWWAQQLVVDYATNDINGYHKFLWKNHLSYAETYEVARRYGYSNFNETRKQFFTELPDRMKGIGINIKKDIESVFEVGCSSGYLLRHMETDVFPSANCIRGNDIDKYSVNEGNKCLDNMGSCIELYYSDMEHLDQLLGKDQYDFTLAAGVLLYLDQAAATRLIKIMLNYTRKMMAITALANPDEDNFKLDKSVPRKRDHTWIHNVDAMIEQAGGKVVSRRWEGSKVVDGNTIYFLFATPA